MASRRGPQGNNRPEDVSIKTKLELGRKGQDMVESYGRIARLLVADAGYKDIDRTNRRFAGAETVINGTEDHLMRMGNTLTELQKYADEIGNKAASIKTQAQTLAQARRMKGDVQTD